MFEEPNDDSQSRPLDPKERAQSKLDQFRMHAELAAVFEGNRKLDARIVPRLDQQLARECQQIVGRLERSRLADTPVISEQSAPQAVELLNLPAARGISTNDYHIHRRPGEVMILRWLAGDQVETFYTRLQAHFDAAIKQHQEDERQSHGWKQDERTLAYLAALDAIEVKMPDRYLREVIRQHRVYILSTQAADEMDILHLSDFLMGVPAAQIVGPASAPPDQPTERDRAWYCKLFSLRGMSNNQEQMFFFTYLQKSDDTAEWEQEDWKDEET